MSNNKPYKPEEINNISMLPGDQNGSPDESFFYDTLVFVDEAFLNKLSKYFGKSRYIKFDKIDFCINISKNQRLKCKKIFYYTAPPFQSSFPSIEEETKKKGYDKFIKRLKERGVIIREGRCQRLKIDNNFKYKQKAVDVLLTMDLTNIPIIFPKIKKIILISSDSDFVPVIQNLKKQNIKTILYTYYKKKRNTDFSRSNDLIKSVHKYVILTKQDFEDAPLSEKNKGDEK